MLEPLPHNANEGERLARIETVVTDMHRRLFGNGQPGELQTIRQDVDELKQMKWKAIGAIGATMALVEIAHLVFGK